MQYIAGQSEAAKKRLLTTLIVGGGPTGESVICTSAQHSLFCLNLFYSRDQRLITFCALHEGVEFAGELSDLISTELRAIDGARAAQTR